MANMKDAPRDGTRIAVFDEHDQYHPAVWWTDAQSGWTDGEFTIQGVHLWLPCYEAAPEADRPVRASVVKTCGCVTCQCGSKARKDR